jgi:hypothetical protein
MVQYDQLQNFWDIVIMLKGEGSLNNGLSRDPFPYLFENPLSRLSRDPIAKKKYYNNNNAFNPK